MNLHADLEDQQRIAEHDEGQPRCVPRHDLTDDHRQGRQRNNRVAARPVNWFENTDDKCGGNTREKANGEKTYVHARSPFLKGFHAHTVDEDHAGSIEDRASDKIELSSPVVIDEGLWNGDPSKGKH